MVISGDGKFEPIRTIFSLWLSSGKPSVDNPFLQHPFLIFEIFRAFRQDLVGFGVKPSVLFITCKSKASLFSKKFVMIQIRLFCIGMSFRVLKIYFSGAILPVQGISMIF